MAGWKDLPVELKRRIVLRLDDDRAVCTGVADPNSPARLTLKALSIVDRELDEITGAILWRALTLTDRTPASLDYWTRSLAPRRACHVRQLLVHPEGLKDITTWESLPFYIEALHSTINVTSLQLHAPSFFTSALFSTLRPQILEKVTRLALTGGQSAFGYNGLPDPSKFVSALVATQVLHSLPNLDSLSLVHISETNNPVPLIKALQSLEHLTSLSLEHFGSFDHPQVAAPWRSCLRNLTLGDSMQNSTLFPLLAHHASKLRFLALLRLDPYTPLPSSLPAPFPNLISLHISSERGTANLPLLFAASPLRLLYVKLLVGDAEAHASLLGLSRAFAAITAHGLRVLRRIVLRLEGVGLDDRGEDMVMKLWSVANAQLVGLHIELAEDKY